MPVDPSEYFPLGTKVEWFAGSTNYFGIVVKYNRSMIYVKVMHTHDIVLSRKVDVVYSSHYTNVSTVDVEAEIAFLRFMLEHGRYNHLKKHFRRF